MIYKIPGLFRRFNVLIFFGTVLLVCSTAQAETMLVTASVAPLRVVTVDNQHMIMKISSNSSRNVEPVVYLQTKPKTPIAYDSKIRNQYATLSKSINFSKRGIVYNRAAHHPQKQNSFLKKILDYAGT